MPVLVIQDVAEDETGIATSLNAIFRKVGSAIAAAVFAALLNPASDGGTPETAFTAIFALGAVTAVVAILLAVRRR